MSKEIIKYLKNSIDEKGNYCYSLPVETTKAVIKELDRLNNILDELEKWCNNGIKNGIHIAYEQDLNYEDVLDKLKELKEE